MAWLRSAGRKNIDSWSGPTGGGPSRKIKIHVWSKNLCENNSLMSNVKLKFREQIMGNKSISIRLFSCHTTSAGSGLDWFWFYSQTRNDSSFFLHPPTPSSTFWTFRTAPFYSQTFSVYFYSAYWHWTFESTCFTSCFTIWSYSVGNICRKTIQWAHS